MGFAGWLCTWRCWGSYVSCVHGAGEIVGLLCTCRWWGRGLAVYMSLMGSWVSCVHVVDGVVG